MSVQNDIHNYLATMAKGATGDYVPATPEMVSTQLGVERNKVNKTFFNLMTHNKIEVLRGPNGRSIIGYRLIAEPGAPKREVRVPRQVDRERQAEVVVVAPGAHLTRRRGLLTPSLDAYADAKHRFLGVKEEFGGLVEASFNENPYAEEGLQLKGRLESIETQWSELRRRLDETERELKYLRGSRRDELAKSAIESGAMVQHGD